MRKSLFSGSLDLGLLILRVGVAGMLLFSHGLPKLMGFNKMFHTFSDPLGVGSELSYLLAVFAEFFCSAAVIIGWYTRWAVVPIIITMLVAAFVVHGADPFSKKELALLYAIPLFTLLLTGPGRFSLNRQ